MINILIAEYDFRIANIHEAFLMKIEGLQIVGKAINGKETLSMINAYKPDVLLLDIFLPDYLGTELIQMARGIHPKLDVIVITAATEKELLEKSIRQGIVNYLIKPVSMEKFTTVINDYKRQRTLLEEKEHLDQQTVDKLFSTSINNEESKEEPLPKGIDRVTLSKVQYYMVNSKTSWSAEEMGTQIGASRTTARRYLEYLVQRGDVKVEQDYGVVGRPERKYYAN